jgi:N-acetylmuramoyl-L-alanine amidase
MNIIFKIIIKPILSILMMYSVLAGCGSKNTNLKYKIICIDPGHGGTANSDSFRIGPTGEREEWINLRVALELKRILEIKNCEVILTRTEDVPIPLKDRALIAIENNADVFISIHHNATADNSVNFPIVYFHGNASENQASVQLGRSVIKHMSKLVFNNETQKSLVSDHTIFPISGAAVLRHSYGIPGIIGEASFFTHPAEETRLKTKEYNVLEARAYYEALEEFFSKEPYPIRKKFSIIQIPPFTVLQESSRMDPVVLLWQQDYNDAVRLFYVKNKDSIQKSYNLFTRSAKSFPDSWLAGSAHTYRVKILEKLQKKNESETEKKRISEFYINLK